MQHKRRRLALKRRQSERVKDAAVCFFPTRSLQSFFSPKESFTYEI
jgi:hypothetical protein